MQTTEKQLTLGKGKNAKKTTRCAICYNNMYRRQNVYTGLLLLHYRLTALQESGFYEVFAHYMSHEQRSNGECKLTTMYRPVSLFIYSSRCRFIGADI